MPVLLEVLRSQRRSRLGQTFAPVLRSVRACVVVQLSTTTGWGRVLGIA
jgi:hypothetical protein